MSDPRTEDLAIAGIKELSKRIRSLEAKLAAAKKIIRIGMVHPIGDPKDRYREAKEFLESHPPEARDINGIQYDRNKTVQPKGSDRVRECSVRSSAKEQTDGAYRDIERTARSSGAGKSEIGGGLDRRLAAAKASGSKEE